jgi:hypothetical protein
MDRRVVNIVVSRIVLCGRLIIYSLGLKCPTINTLTTQETLLFYAVNVIDGFMTKKTIEIAL